MREENFGPVANPDGSPTDLTRAMLAGTGRDPVAFARQASRQPMVARIIDETEVRRDHGPGSDRVVTDVEVCVTGAPNGEAARKEAEWHARHEADGEVERLDYHATEGPMTLDGQYIVRLTVETLRYF